MAFWGISRLTRRPAFAVVARYGLALLLGRDGARTTLILRHYNFPAHFISHFTLIAIAIHFFGAPGQVQVCSLTYFFFGVSILARTSGFLALLAPLEAVRIQRRRRIVQKADFLAKNAHPQRRKVSKRADLDLSGAPKSDGDCDQGEVGDEVSREL